MRRAAVYGLVAVCSCIWPGQSLADPPLQSAPQEGPSVVKHSDAAQGVKPGATVRLRTTLPEGTIKGVIKSMDDTQVTVVDRAHQETAVPWTAIKRLDLQIGVRHSYGKGALIGGGVAAFILLVAPNKEPCMAPGCPENEMYDKPHAALIGGAVGALVGLGVAAASKPTAPKWQTVRPPHLPSTGTAVRLGVAPGRDGLGVRLVLSY